MNIVTCSSFSVMSTHNHAEDSNWHLCIFDVTLDLGGSNIGHRMGCHIVWPVTRLHFPHAQFMRCEEIATLSIATPQTVELALYVGPHGVDHTY